MDAMKDTNKRALISIVGIALGVLALGLAIVPSMALGRPMPNPFADKKEEAAVSRDEGVTLQYKKLSIKLGGKTAEASEKSPEITRDPIQWFNMGAAVMALVGIAVTVIGHWKEGQTFMTVSAMSCCVMAITWQYVAVGIAIGVGVAIFLLILSQLGSSL